MNERITIRLEPEIVQALDRFLEQNRPGCRSRQDAFRFIVRDWLADNELLDVPVDTGGRADSAADKPDA